MKMLALRKSGLEVSAVGFAGMGLNFAYGRGLEKHEAIALIRAAYERAADSLCLIGVDDPCPSPKPRCRPAIAAS